MNLRDFVDSKTRREALEKELGVDLGNIGSFSLSEDTVSKKNCENMIGVAQVPMGAAGPIRIKNLELRSKNEYYIPLATTEGALVASVNRGCMAIGQSGGATVLSENVGMSRAPVFVVENIEEGKALMEWVESNFEEIKEVTESTSNHLKLKRVKSYMMGKNVWLRFVFDTGDAMGMNMVTIAVDKVLPLIEEETRARCVAISGNMCVDKKPNFFNFVEGRGVRVWGEVVLSEDVVKSVLKTSVDEIVEVANRKLYQGSIGSGSIGANAHFANILAAIFIATGQDAAHVGECSMGVTSVEKVEDGLYFSVYLPDLVVGTVGGGTGLATQREALSIMGFEKSEENNKLRFAEVIAGAVMAGELSLLASIADGSLARAHAKYGRGNNNIKI